MINDTVLCLAIGVMIGLLWTINSHLRAIHLMLKERKRRRQTMTIVDELWGSCKGIFKNRKEILDEPEEAADDRNL